MRGYWPREIVTRQVLCQEEFARNPIGDRGDLSQFALIHISLTCAIVAAPARKQRGARHGHPIRCLNTMNKILSLFAIVLFACGASFPQANSSPEAAAHAASSLAQDRHEGLAISADPYTDTGRAKARFGKANPIPVGILPVEVFITNETPQPIRINMETIQLTVHYDNGRQEGVDWLPIGEVAKAIAHPHGPAAPKQPRFPIGVQTGADKKVDELTEILRPYGLDVDVIPPLGKLHGFLFFDVNHDLSLAERSSLYVPDVTNEPAKKPLMFFEVGLGK